MVQQPSFEKPGSIRKAILDHRTAGQEAGQSSLPSPTRWRYRAPGLFQPLGNGSVRRRRSKTSNREGDATRKEHRAHLRHRHCGRACGSCLPPYLKQIAQEPRPLLSVASVAPAEAYCSRASSFRAFNQRWVHNDAGITTRMLACLSSFGPMNGDKLNLAR